MKIHLYGPIRLCEQAIDLMGGDWKWTGCASNPAYNSSYVADRFAFRSADIRAMVDLFPGIQFEIH
jgi:hypothetical protein